MDQNNNSFTIADSANSEKSPSERLLEVLAEFAIQMKTADPQAKTIPSRWVFCNKGDSQNPDVRARLVGCEIKTYKDDSFYASTPPLESKRMLFSDFATRRKDSKGRLLKLSFVDVVKAYFNAIPQRKIFVRLPRELGLESGLYGKLIRCMYGTRDAAHLWEIVTARHL